MKSLYLLAGLILVVTGPLLVTRAGNAADGGRPASREGADAGLIWDQERVNSAGLAPVVMNTGSIGFFEFPSDSYLSYAYSLHLLFGTVRGNDTLVSNAGFFEFTSFEPLQRRSSDISSPWTDQSATAPDELHAWFSDTASSPSPVDNLDLRKHKPIGLSVDQRTLAWDAGIGQQMIFAEWTITVISTVALRDSYAGLWITPTTVHHPNWPTRIPAGSSADDDICGFIRTAPGIVKGTRDTVMSAWSADNDGDPAGTVLTFNSHSVRDALGVRILRVQPDAGELSFNWWARETTESWPSPLDWGPRSRALRNGYAGSLGSPSGDRSFYWLMSNGEIDYDQALAALDMSADGWDSPSSDMSLMNSIAAGSNIGYILAAGPFPTLERGDMISLTAAFVIGRDFHNDPANFVSNFSPSDPERYLAGLDFADLMTALRWADWVFDNPGVDTDGNGYRGEAYLVNCVDGRCDSVFYKGDGVPDWRGPSAPPPPPLEMTTRPHEVTLRWTGAYTETHADAFSGERDFEGYRLYLGRFDRNDQYSLIASWDKVDYERVAYDPKTDEWRTASYPLTEDEWPEALGDPEFSVFDHTEPSFAAAYIDTVQDTIYNDAGQIVGFRDRTRYSYWVPHGLNRANEYVEGGVVEQNFIQQVGTRDTLIGTEIFTYGIYEATLTNLNAAVPLYVVGDGVRLRRLQTRRCRRWSQLQTNNSKYAEFIYSTDVVIDSGLRVAVFPNPYKLAYRDGRGEWTSYYQEGYEGRGIHQFEEQDRRIHFVNLPDTATISIYTLDGDLVRRIHHPDRFLTTYPSSVGWDLVTRNVQAAVSGIYIWKVDSRLGSQTGKLVIIK
jgi:hypothetical protein